eukprot:g5936.t1
MWTRCKKGNIYDHYSVLETLGRGMTGDVVLIEHNRTKSQFACKKVKKNHYKQNLVVELRREISVLMTLDHPNVIKLYETWEDPDTIFLILEVARGGELYENLTSQKDGGHYTEKRAGELFLMMVKAIAYCHEHGVAHRDLKLENFVFSRGGSELDTSPLKLIDFGLSKKYGKRGQTENGTGIARMKSLVGTPYYIAPEILKRKPNYSSKADVWSLGVILYMMLSGRPPFDSKQGDTAGIFRAVKLGKPSFEGVAWENISDEGKSLCRALLQTNPKKRLSAHDALKHPWVERSKLYAKPLDAEGVARALRSFVCFPKLKQTVIDIISFTMSESEVTALRNNFVQMDVDRTGKVTFNEFQAALESSNMKFTHEEVKSMFQSLDRNQTGSLDYSEFLAATLQSSAYLEETRLREAFNTLDVDNSGYITAENLLEVLGSKFSNSEVLQMIKEADILNNNKVSWDEFITLMRQDSVSSDLSRQNSAKNTVKYEPLKNRKEKKKQILPKEDSALGVLHIQMVDDVVKTDIDKI